MGVFKAVAIQFKQNANSRLKIPSKRYENGQVPPLLDPDSFQCSFQEQPSDLCPCHQAHPPGLHGSLKQFNMQLREKFTS